MLQVASFPITDAEGINSLLKKYRLAPNAHILVSEGHVCIPFEDGEPENSSQKLVAITEMKNAHLKELFLIEHSERVNQKQIADVQEHLNFLKTQEPKSDGYIKAEVRKEHEDKVKGAENRLTQLQNQSLQNQSEVSRIKLNIDIFEEELASL